MYLSLNQTITAIRNETQVLSLHKYKLMSVKWPSSISVACIPASQLTRTTIFFALNIFTL